MVIETSESEFFVSVIYERRADGGYRIHSDDVPGFVLSHSNPKLVFADIIPALETILHARLGKTVRVALPGSLRELKVTTDTIDIDNKSAGTISYVAIAA